MMDILYSFAHFYKECHIGNEVVSCIDTTPYMKIDLLSAMQVHFYKTDVKRKAKQQIFEEELTLFLTNTSQGIA